jgi:hypothetical protein
VIAPRNTTVPYNRDDYGDWIDADGDCQDTRAEVLIAESTVPVTLSGNGCTVVAGSWTSPYDGATWTAPADVDIDHLVALGNAHESGGWAWDAATKHAYANDLADAMHLIAVTDNVNQSKGDRAPEAWKPPLTSYWCAYATSWIDVKVRWHLSVTDAEYSSLQTMLATC